MHGDIQCKPIFAKANYKYVVTRHGDLSMRRCEVPRLVGLRMQRDGRQLGNELMTVPSAPSMDFTVGHTKCRFTPRG